MVAVTQAVPSNEHSVHVHPVDPSSSSVLFDVSIYLVRHIRSFVNDPAGDTIFDPGLGLLPRWAVATFYALYGGVVVYMNVDMLYHVTTLVRRIVLLASSLAVASAFQLPVDVHIDRGCVQLLLAPVLRDVFVVHAERPGTLLAAFGVTAVMHNLGM
jgi:hypothetical protein